MPSTAKTKTLRLNQFVGSDKPKMDDFNYDNTQLETVVGGHLPMLRRPDQRGAQGLVPAGLRCCSSMTATDAGGAAALPEL